MLTLYYIEKVAYTKDNPAQRRTRLDRTGMDLTGMDRIEMEGQGL